MIETVAGGALVLRRLGRAELGLMLDHIPAAVAFWDAAGINRYANQAYLDWCGKQPEEVLGTHVTELLGPELAERVGHHVEGALAGYPQEFEHSWADPDGRTRHLHASYTPHIVDGRPSGFFALVTDISTRVRAERMLQEAARQMALLEERRRMAADLHDLVVQRLFAAGLDLAAAQRGGPEAAERVDSAAVAVDLAIRELRGAIHELHVLTTPRELPETIERTLVTASRLLGFMPTMTYIGSVDALRTAVCQDLLAVLNESLSNVARHAEATAVEVTLACDEAQLLLRVADDGKGVQDSTRSSGLSNMRHRAEAHGGSFACSRNHPRGTVVEWTVPVS